MGTHATSLDQTRAPWLGMDEVATLFARLERAGGKARFVGGCVRDALLQRPVQTADLDIVTTLRPEAVMAAVERSVPTGLAHGTVTVLIGDVRFEVTTLRRDVACDGRHAEVAFTDDFMEDAARRDFTVNAMSCDPDGLVFDYFSGLDDLRAGRLRFVGDPATRIEEDYLRILRFFRFMPGLAREPADPAILAAIRTHLDGLDRLSGERIAAELRKLLQRPKPFAALSLMNECGVTARLFGAPFALDALAHVEKLDLDADWLSRLVLLARGRLDPEALGRRLRLSNDECEALIPGCNGPLPPGADQPRALRAWAYRHGVASTSMMALVAAGMERRSRQWVKDVHFVLEAFGEPSMPVRGRDLMALGHAAGPALGRLLRMLEERWIASDFTLGRDELLRERPDKDP